MFEQTFKNIDDALWKEAGCSNELDYTEQTSWLLFLKYLDGLEQDHADEAALSGQPTEDRNGAAQRTSVPYRSIPKSKRSSQPSGVSKVVTFQ